jgi:hypothetical protein
MSLRRFLNRIAPAWNSFVWPRESARRGYRGKRQKRFEPLEPRWALDGSDLSLSVPSGATLWIDDVAVDEAEGTAVFTVSCLGATDTVTVEFQTVGDTAESGSDFDAVSGVLTFQPGQTSLTVTVPIIDDMLAELSEQFFVELANAQGAVIVDAQGAAIIASSDNAPTIEGFSVLQTSEEYWTISGSVSDLDEDPAGFVVRFGGVLSSFNLTATVQSDGTFSLVANLTGIASGNATAQTTDSDGLNSNLATYFVL